MACAYENLPAETKAKSRFVIGPWDHTLGIPPGLDYPGSRLCGIMSVKAALEWFDCQLRGRALR